MLPPLKKTSHMDAVQLTKRLITIFMSFGLSFFFLIGGKKGRGQEERGEGASRNGEGARRKGRGTRRKEGGARRKEGESLHGQNVVLVYQSLAQMLPVSLELLG